MAVNINARAHRPYSAPKVHLPETSDLSPNGKSVTLPTEIASFGPS